MYSYTLIRARRKTMSLSVNEDETIVVRAPLSAAQTTIDAFVASHDAWIARAIARRRAHHAAYPPLSEQQAALLREQAKVVLPQKVAYFAARMGLSPQGVQITAAQKRFGSCSQNGKLHFSYRLLRYPEAAVDYVVVHELAHLVHFNHGAAFYALIATILPDYRTRAAMLGARLPKQ